MIIAEPRSKAVQLEEPKYINDYNDDIMIYNPGPYVVHVLVGADETIVATTSCMPICAVEKGVYRKGRNGWLAILCPEGIQKIWVFIGEGN